MAIDFTLTESQRRLQSVTREFATEVLAPAVQKADEEPDTQKAFQMMNGPYKEAYKLGLAMGFLPKEYGGGGVSNVDLQIVAEEICAVDPGFATIALVNGLGLMPVAWFGSEEQKRKWIGEATRDPTAEYLAGWTVSEAAGTPGGTANFDSPGVGPIGIGLTATHDKGRGEYVLNGRKHWPCNAGGWDLKGANVNVCIVRTDTKKGGKSGLSGMLVPRGAPGLSFEQPISKIGHRTCQNNSIVFENCRVPEENVFAVGDGDLIISKAFTWSGPVAAIAAVGWLAIRYFIVERGPEVTVTFADAGGIQAGNTKVRYKDMEVGEVEDAKLSKDLSHVTVTLRLHSNMEKALTTGTRFWIVGGHLSATDLSALKTIVSGSYIEMDPGPGAPARHFAGLDSPPPVRFGTAGTRFTLHAKQLGSLSAGSAVDYLGLEVGKVES
jgi:alkylation response protein AidB-like acyl-CoA dehydrogenase